MCPPNATSHGHGQGNHPHAPPTSDRAPNAAAARAIPSPDELQRDFARVPPSVLAHVVDVHCHPTDSEDTTTRAAVAALPGRMCAMATRRGDQDRVAGLARAHPDKVVPCFGYHPWFYHWIALSPASSKEAHYRALFLPDSPPPTPELLTAFEKLLPFLPEPVPLSDVTSDVRTHLSEFPNAMLGEVGIDRACRIPYSRPAEPPYAKHIASNDGGPRELSPFTTPLEHQLVILEAQLEIAVELRRNVSLHSVKCQQATGELLDRMKSKHGAAWLRISIDLHSCGLSAQTWQQIAKRHPNAFLSLSTAINARSPAHKALIAACAPDRILVESDFPDARLGAAYTWHMLCTVAAVKGWRIEDAWDAAHADEREWGAVRRLEENWGLFERGGHREHVQRKRRRDRAIEEWEEANEESE